MVKVTVVDEKDTNTRSPYAQSEASTSTDSLSSVGSDLDQNESFFDRVSALVDIIPPSTRHTIATRVGTAAGYMKTTAKVAGNVVWVITTSAILIALPLALAIEDEAKLVAQEREQMEQQQGQQQVLSFSSVSAGLETDDSPDASSNNVSSTSRFHLSTWPVEVTRLLVSSVSYMSYTQSLSMRRIPYLITRFGFCILHTSLSTAELCHGLDARQRLINKNTQTRLRGRTHLPSFAGIRMGRVRLNLRPTQLLS